MNRILVLVSISASILSCRPFDPILCRTCIDSPGCGPGLTCEQGFCVSPTDRCGLLDAARCGDGPACGDGFECFEDRCESPVEVDAGDLHACVRWKSGRVSCWGNNDSGQASGDKARILPAEVRGIDDATDIALGRDFSCALRAGGRVSCWGDNAYGQLGNQSTVAGAELFQSESTPVDVSLNAPARMITAASYTACAVTIDDDLYCWGRGGFNANETCLLGTTNAAPQQTPVRVAQGVDFEQIDGGEGLFLARAGGRVFGWGADYSSALGTQGQSLCTPTDLGYEDVQMTGASSVASCVLFENGTARCLGVDYFNQINGGRAIDLGEAGTELRGGGNASCLRTASKGIACWGYGATGIAGNERLRSAPPTFVSGTVGATQFALGHREFGCFVRPDDGVYCWGNNQDGQLGDGHTSWRPPRRVSDGPYIDIASGADHTCAVDVEGRVVCWGSNQHQALGLGFVSAVEQATVVPNIRASQVAALYTATCVVDVSGELWCWGRLDRVPNDHPNPLTLSTPRHIPGMANPRAIATGDYHLCGLFDDAPRVRCIGSNFWGQLDGTPSTTRIHVTGQPVTTTIDPDFVSGGTSHTCVADTDGNVECWGILSSSPLTATVPGAVELDAGEHFNCVRLGDGRVECWGVNTNGQLGRGTSGGPETSGPVVDLGAVSMVDAHSRRACVLRDDRLWCWGWEMLRGRLGNDREGDALSPIEIAGMPPLRQVSLGFSSACGIDFDGAAWCFGGDILGAVTGVQSLEVAPIRVNELW